MAWIKNTLSFDDEQRILSKLVERVKVFAGLTVNEAFELLTQAEKASFEAGSTIVTEGNIGQHMYIILSGEALVSKKGRDAAVELARLNSAESFGEMSLIENTQRSASVTAVTPCLLVRFTANHIETQPIIAAKIYRNLASIMSRRLREADEQLSWRV